MCQDIHKLYAGRVDVLRTADINGSRRSVLLMLFAVLSCTYTYVQLLLPARLASDDP